MRFKLTIAYNGIKFHGFQRQNNQTTIQQTLETVISETLKEEIKIHGAGRTDSLVHAYGQVIDFKTTRNIKPNNLKMALNKRLKPDIYVKEVEIVDDKFHSRIDAKEKEYHYLLSKAPFDPVKASYIYYTEKDFDDKKFIDALNLFTGKHNFKNVCKKTPDQDTIRTIKEIKVNINNTDYEVIIKGDGFLRNMVRIIIAVSLRYAMGLIDKNYIDNLLNEANDIRAPWTASPCGLYLWKVTY